MCTHCAAHAWRENCSFVKTFNCLIVCVCKSGSNIMVYWVIRHLVKKPDIEFLLFTKCFNN